MQILVLLNRIPYPAHDGGAIAMYNMLKGLEENGVDLHILAFNTKKHFIDLKDLPSDFPGKKNLKSVYLNADVEILPAILNLFSNKSYNISRFNSKLFESELKKILQSEKFDIIQFEGLFVCPYIDMAQKYSKAKRIYRAHNVEYTIWKRLSAASKNPIKKWYLEILANRLKKFESKIINSFDGIVPITNEDSRVLKKISPLIPHFVSQTGLLPLKESTTIELEKNSIFHIGALNWMPNQEGVNWFLENCWPELNKRNPDLKFYIAGKHTPKKYFDLNLPNVFFLGEVKDSREFMLSKNIMIVPLLSGSGMRIKIIEGLQLGKVIISTRVGAEGIDVKEDENILIGNSPNEFISKIENALNSNSLCSEISKNAKVFVEQNFDNFTSIKKLIGFYSQLRNV